MNKLFIGLLIAIGVVMVVFGVILGKKAKEYTDLYNTEKAQDKEYGLDVEASDYSNRHSHDKTNNTWGAVLLSAGGVLLFIFCYNKWKGEDVSAQFGAGPNYEEKNMKCTNKNYSPGGTFIRMEEHTTKGKKYDGYKYTNVCCEMDIPELYGRPKLRNECMQSLKKPVKKQTTNNGQLSAVNDAILGNRRDPT